MEKAHTAGRSGAILAVLAFAGIVVSLTQTVVVPLLGQLPQILHTSPANATWVVTVSLLASAVTTPVSGRLGDLYGKRLVLLGSTVPLLAGSVICAVSSSLWPMIVGRGLQGMSAGIVPVGIAALRDLLPRERLGSGIALISSSLGIGGALGLPMAAAVIQYSDWRVLFWTMAALAAVIGVLIFTLIPATPPASAATGRFDVLGALGLGVGLVCLLLAVSKGSSWGWGSGLTIGLFVAAVVVLLLWGWWELAARNPLVDLRVTARPQVLLTNASSMVVGMAMYAQSLVVPQLLQLPKATGYGLGQSMMAMGLWMAPAGLMMMLVSPLGAKLSARSGPKITLIVGCVIIAAGYGSSMALMGSTWGLLIVTLIINTGVGFAYGAMPALVMAAVPQSETAAANSFNTLVRAIGTSVAAAVVGAVLAQMTISLGGHAVASENGFRVSLLIGCGVAVAGALVATFIPGHRTAAIAATAAVDMDAEHSSHSTESVVATAANAVQRNGIARTPREPAVTGPVAFGHVHDSRGAALPNAVLTLISMSGRQIGRALTDAEGYFELAAPEAGSYVLIASIDGRRPDASTVQLAHHPVPCDVVLTAMAGLAGTVSRGDDGAAIAGARVSALDARGEVLSAAATTDDGTFDLTELPEGDFTIAVSANGFHPAALAVRAGGSDTPRLDVTLRPCARLHGVVRGRDGRPLPDALVTLTDWDGTVVDTMVTGPDGAYTFANLHDGTYTVVASGYAPVHTPVVVGGEAEELNVQLGHGKSSDFDAAEQLTARYSAD
ncbi:MFS family permease [Nocardia kruczakiae]|uniref:MFS family permease n=4 Tax=Nocardia kruczakiae TaxID=261477 RepID=A0ABU1XHD6_9NOCA|nr:MFS family permease [Nocardia kruczakiae]